MKCNRNALRALELLNFGNCNSSETNWQKMVAAVITRSAAVAPKLTYACATAPKNLRFDSVVEASN